MTLYNLNDADGDVVAMIKTTLPNEVISSMWSEFWQSDDRPQAEEDGEVAEVFLEKIEAFDPAAEQLWIDNIYV